MSEREQRTVTVPWSGAEATFEAWPEQGAWYAPMLNDGSFDPEEIGEVEFTYAETYGLDEGGSA